MRRCVRCCYRLMTQTSTEYILISRIKGLTFFTGMHRCRPRQSFKQTPYDEKGPGCFQSNLENECMHKITRHVGNQLYHTLNYSSESVRFTELRQLLCDAKVNQLWWPFWIKLTQTCRCTSNNFFLRFIRIHSF